MDAAPGVVSICWSDDSRYVAWTCADGQVRQWDCTEHRLLKPITLPSARFVTYSRPESNYIAVSDESRPIVRIVEAFSGKEVRAVSDHSGDKSSSRSNSNATVIAITPCFVSLSKICTPQGCFATASRRDVNIFTFASAPFASFSCGDVVVAATFAGSDGPFPSLIATGESHGVCRVWDISSPDGLPYSSGSCLHVFNAHSAWVTSLSFLGSNRHRLATASFDGAAKLWDLSDRKPSCTSAHLVKQKRNSVKLHTVALAATDASTPVIVAAGSDCLVRVWDASSEHTSATKCKKDEPTAVLKGHASAVFAVACAPDSSRMVSGSSDGYVRLWVLPGIPIVLSDPKSDKGGVPEDVLAPTRNATGDLIFCPDDARSMKCDICATTYDSGDRAPVVSGVCGHTIACKKCNQQLWEHAGNTPPRCPQCRAELQDVAPNYELIRVLNATGVKSSEQSVTISADASIAPDTAESLDVRSIRQSSNLFLDIREYIDSSRLQWFEAPQCELTSSVYTKTLSGRLDGEAVTIKLAKRFGAGRDDLTLEARRRIESNLIVVSNLRGPHIVQHYGASRVASPDGRILLVGEQCCGGSLANSLSMMRTEEKTLDAVTALTVASQIVRAVLHLHRFGVARPNLTPKALMLSTDLHKWTPEDKVKLEEFGSCITVEGASSSRSLSLANSGEVAYLAPEALDPESSSAPNDKLAFERACRIDMYALAILLWEIFVGAEPWAGMRSAQIIAAVVGREERPGWPPSQAPEGIRTLICSLWSQNPFQRPTAEETLRIFDEVPSAPVS